MPVFLVDTASLGLLSQDSMLLKDSLVKEPHCTFLCTNRDFLTFALFNNLWKYDVRKAVELFDVELCFLIFCSSLIGCLQIRKTLNYNPGY